MIQIQSLKLFEGEQQKTLLQMIHLPAPSAAHIGSVNVQVPSQQAKIKRNLTLVKAVISKKQLSAEKLSQCLPVQNLGLSR